MERFRNVICADIMLTKMINNDKYILLMERKSTGYDDGLFELPGGHLEKSEDIFDAMIREAKEELCIDLNRDDLKIVHIMHHFTGERINFIFEASGDKLNPVIGEESKCSKLEWFNINELPLNMSDKVKQIINNIINNKFYDSL